MTLHTLIIDDHPIIIEANKTALKKVSERMPEYDFKIKTASDADAARNIIEAAINDTPIDLAFLDIRIDPSKDGELISGEDIGLLLRENFENVKIIVITTFNNNFRLNSILKNIDPDALMVKTELTPKNLVTAIETVINNETYYCNTVSSLMRKLIKTDIVLDDIDRKILYEIYKGSTMTEIAETLPISFGTVQNRKRKLKEAFNVTSEGDKSLIQKAKESGFI